MLKVLVADENIEASMDCCQYLANDKNLDVVSSNSGINTLDTYYKVKPNILVINSDFKDKSYTEIINELSSTSQERNNCNIILTVEENTRLEFDSISKLYQLFYLPLRNKNSKIKKSIKQYCLDHYIFYEPNADNLRALFYKLHLYNHCLGADYFKYAIIQCYKNPELINSLNSIFSITSKEFNVSYDSVRPAMRTALKSVNAFRDKNGDNGIFKFFENEDCITPKNFIRIITNHYLKHKK